MADDEIKEENEGSKWSNYLAIAFLLTAYITAVVNVIIVKKNEVVSEAGKGGRVVIRMTHWQLEAGVRQVIDEKAREFEKVYKEQTGVEVKVVQNPINEKAYRQYVQTQCIGGTAPDLIQIGMYDKDYTRRFFRATNEYVTRPNPYNKGTDLEGVAWADTFYDGLNGALDAETLEYYGAGLSMVTVRLFYNKEILREVFGTDAPPKDFRQFLKMCEDLRAWAKKNDMTGFVPIAGSKYQLNFFEKRYTSPLTFDLMFKADLSYSGALDKMETALAYIDGIYSLDSNQIEVSHKAVREITKQFPVGFMAMQRMDAGFAFTRRKSAFIASGVWDANGYIQNADFPVGVCDFPLPTKEDKEFGRFLAGPLSEASVGISMQFGVTKFSQHPDIAMHFLMYLTSRKVNEELNRDFKWLPAIKGAKVYGVMTNFKPTSDGFWGSDFFTGGSYSQAAYEQSLWEYVEHKTTYDQYKEELSKNLPKAYALDLQRAFQTTLERRLVLDATFSFNLGVARYATEWDLPAAEGVKLSETAKLRQRYLWESRISNLVEVYYQEYFKNLLEKGNKMAQKVLSLMTQNPFAEEE